MFLIINIINFSKSSKKDDIFQKIFLSTSQIYSLSLYVFSFNC
nr:MAG TPA: hypothetical protein [Caudoviricetes sp.]